MFLEASNYINDKNPNKLVHQTYYMVIQNIDITMNIKKSTKEKEPQETCVQLLTFVITLNLR